MEPCQTSPPAEGFTKKEGMRPGRTFWILVVGEARALEEASPHLAQTLATLTLGHLSGT